MSFDYDDRNSIESSIYAVEALVQKLLDYEKSEEKFVRDYMIGMAASITPFEYRIKEAKRAYQILMEAYDKDTEEA
jgi:hypothetical protein